MAFDFDKLTTPTTIFGFLATSCGGVAITAGDKLTQGIAAMLCLACCYALAYAIPARSEMVKKTALERLPQDEPMTPSDVLKKPTTIAPAPDDTLSNLGTLYTRRKP